MLTEYITIQGDRLDTIAFKAYGDPFKWAPIVDSNPSLPIQAEYPAGIRIVLPVVEDVDLIELDLLPPWKK
jgi:phage tail protein X